MPKLDLDSMVPENSTLYPPPFDQPVRGRWKRRLGAAAGLTELGACHVVLNPGAWSSQRHWHEGEDEFLVMLSGEAMLVEDEGETLLRPGDCVAWPKGVPDGHNVINRSNADCAFICFSAGDAQAGGSYSDIDMKWNADGFFHKDGTPYA